MSFYIFEIMVFFNTDLLKMLLILIAVDIMLFKKKYIYSRPFNFTNLGHSLIVGKLMAREC